MFQYESPLAVCLIDGDGAIFSREYLMQGEAGGRKAAERLSSGIMDYIRTSTHHIPTGVKIWTVVFLSKAGLEQTLNRFVSPFVLFGPHLISTARIFARRKRSNYSSVSLGLFLRATRLLTQPKMDLTRPMAYSQSSMLVATRRPPITSYEVRLISHSLMTYAYLRLDHLDILIRIPQVYKIFFAGSHDNGYVHVLASMQTVGYLDKLVILRSYMDVARQIENLNIPVYEIPDLFLKEKLDFAKMYKQQRQGDASPIKQSKRSDSASSLPKFTTKGAAKESQTPPRKIDAKLVRFVLFRVFITLMPLQPLHKRKPSLRLVAPT